MGLAAKFLEESGFTTVVLTPTPEFHIATGIPRSVGIAYPYGRLLGEVDDVRGQRDVLTATLMALAKADGPGSIQYLPFEWPEEPKNAKWHPPEMSPIIKLQLDAIRQARKNEKREMNND